MASTAPNLPLPKLDQAFCNVSALEAGFLTIPGKIFVAGADDNDRHRAPSLAFLITHVPSGKRLLFDLGLSPDEDCPAYTPAAKKSLPIFEIDIPKDVVASLKAGGLDPDDIRDICISHAHFDHVGDPRKFERARFMVSKGAHALFNPGYPEDPMGMCHSRLLPEDRTDFLNTQGPNWKPVGPFERALDYFGDGSLYIIDAPGHLPGHVNILARTSPDGGWVYLAGDSAHDWRLLRGQTDIAVLKKPYFGITCMHLDPTKARENIRRIASLLSVPRVRVILAHDNEFYDEHKEKDSFWPGKIPSL